MARTPKLWFDRGTLLLHPPPRGKTWIDFATWDDRVEKFRIPAIAYRPLVETLREAGTVFEDEAKGFVPLDLVSRLEMTPYPHQEEALEAWKQAGRCGVVVLPTAAGKTYLAQLCIEQTPRSTLIVVPTLDLMHQWYAHLMAAFPETEIGLLGGGSHDRTPILVSTYDSAAIHAEHIGDRYGFVIFDECHHLPTEFYRVIAEYSIAPYRLGLTATPERSDGKHDDLRDLIGEEVYRRRPEDLAGHTLAEHRIEQIKVKLSETERREYDDAIAVRNAFLQQAKVNLSSLKGWQNFVKASATSPQGRRAMKAHHTAKAIALGTEAKLRVLADLLAEHYPEPILIFTNDNATVYRISQDFLIPAITHQTPVKERHEVLSRFRSGEYRTLAASHVLNEGVDVPEARIAILLSGSGSTREYIQRLGRVLRKGKSKDKQAILYEVVSENTTEERTSKRRRGKPKPQPSPKQPRQLELVSDPNEPIPLYGRRSRQTQRAAESKGQWNSDSYNSEEE
ncbi:DEAD/DEAH box helicase [Baaleninema simplex]|uniref:DEAD/DEAH box helicase n=1 Tax=Baaleninema simplex TaxID=2862350 RepID=UPI0003451961|nr:DEAD/DEAH box helicase family protein [Baaleninema simplex]